MSSNDEAPSPEAACRPAATPEAEAEAACRPAAGPEAACRPAATLEAACRPADQLSCRPAPECLPAERKKWFLIGLLVGIAALLVVGWAMGWLSF